MSADQRDHSPAVDTVFELTAEEYQQLQDLLLRKYFEDVPF
jgi:hypothetical protein